MKPALILTLIFFYCFIEFIAIWLFIAIMLSNDTFYYNESYVKSYIKFIYDELIYEDRFNYPLSKLRISRYTKIGKLFFMIVWITIFGIPFIIACIFNFFLLRIKMFFKKLLFKAPEEDTHDIDH